MVKPPWSSLKTSVALEKAVRRGTWGPHTWIPFSSELYLWPMLDFSARIIKVKVFSHTSSLATQVTSPRLHSQACLQPHLHFQELCVCPGEGPPPEPPGGFYWAPPSQRSICLVPAAPWQTVAAAFTWAFAEVHRRFIQSDMRMPSAATVLKRTWPAVAGTFPHQMSRGSWRARLKPRRETGPQDRVGRWLTHMVYVQLWSCSRRIDFSLQDGKVRDIAPEWPIATSQMGVLLAESKPRLCEGRRMRCFKQLWESLERFDFDCVLSVFTITVATSHSWV